MRTGRRKGVWNMAADLVLMDMVDRGRPDFVLRTYQWDPPCVSLGRLQRPASEVDPLRVRAAGFDMVRRPTGGRAVLHHTEITYSIAASRSLPLVSGSVSESLRRISRPLAAALRALGADVSAGPAERRGPGRRRPANPCFTSHGRWEIATPDGRKLVGSAQARRRGVFLEHGSIILENRQHLMADLLPEGVSDRWRQRIRELLLRGTGALGELVEDLRPGDLRRALEVEFGKAVGRPLERMDPEELDSAEMAAASAECSLDGLHSRGRA
jgi:lipoate-protein ligase A